MNGDFSELIEYLDDKFQNTVTKQDLANMSVKLATLEEFDNFKQEVKEEFSEIKGSINALTNSIDKLVKTIDDLMVEYVSFKNQIDRHEKWFHEIAEKLNIKLNY